ncbi:c-type cytochrome [Idiomarina ramblicola]|uniref:Cytochrome C556 n=1 Tax=Idiomarina ramblicola TaxID=263724 RepID=A0A432Z644_9GAMM|nr:cytochrome c [Idiomarina ramblicola]RUO73361.1 cytochrome C556 [Idiomarina ramblicola]
MKKQLLTTALAGLIGLSFNVSADETAFNDADKAVEYRQKALSVMKENFSAMAAMVKGEVEYNADFFQRRAGDFEKMSGIPWSGFAVEGAMPGNNSDALTAIWDNWEDFQQRANDLQEYAAKLAEVSQQGSLDSIKPVFMDTAETCKGCHDEYKD